jgi:hypothetical protein
MNFYELNNSPLSLDYPEIDENIDFKTDHDYINENAEDYIIRTDQSEYELPSNVILNEDDQDNFADFDGDTSKKIPVVHSPETYRKAASNVVNQKQQYNFIENCITILYKFLFSEIPKDKNRWEFYNDMLLEDSAYIYIIFLLMLVIFILVLLFV